MYIYAGAEIEQDALLVMRQCGAVALYTVLELYGPVDATLVVPAKYLSFFFLGECMLY